MSTSPTPTGIATGSRPVPPRSSTPSGCCGRRNLVPSTRMPGQTGPTAKTANSGTPLQATSATTRLWHRHPRNLTGNLYASHEGSRWRTSGYNGKAMDWTDEFPACCPPPDAQTPHGVVIRLVEADPPRASDFVALAKVRPNAQMGNNELYCQAQGLSVFRDAEDAAKMQRQVPALKKHLLAEADIGGEPGLIKPTPSRNDPKSSHHTWWVPSSYSPAMHFYVRKEE